MVSGPAWHPQPMHRQEIRPGEKKVLPTRHSVREPVPTMITRPSDLPPTAAPSPCGRPGPRARRTGPRTCPLAAPLAALLLALLAGCSGDALVGVHVDLTADGSGTLTTRALVEDARANDAENRTTGTTWELRASLVSSQGRFADIAQVALGDGDVTFAPQLGGDRPGLRVTIARGADCKWIETLVPDREARQKLAKAYDPSGRTRELADLIRFEVRTPGRVVTSGVLPSGRGVESDRDGKRATLLLPVRTAREAGDAFVWDISWLDG